MKYSQRYHAELVNRDAETRRVRLTLRAALLGVVLTGFFAWFDGWVTGYVFHALAEGISCVALSWLVWGLHRGYAPQILPLLGVALAAVLLAILTVTGAPGDGVVIWAALLPPLAFFVLGVWRGLLVSLGFCLILNLTLWLCITLIPAFGLNWLAMVNVGASLLASTVLSLLYEHSRAHSARRLAHAASTDPLTGVANRRGFLAGFECHMAVAVRSCSPISLLLFDLDRLKQLNDELGHAAGDAAICHVVTVIEGMIRAQDLLARLGGDEFALLLPDTDLAGAAALAHKLQAALAQTPLEVAGTRWPLTLSIGLAEAAPGETDYDRLASVADRCLYRAKEGGRDRVVDRC
ncbi:GGDEF domain-containing protein [Marichromatium bheemlicum]|uniref:diguanylate cyclase n=1 Tax=Marichromatium bheemlicum TaxID=365339 RepID=A0ABX1I460_9GAMM|nr:GGDEF domain-containing protein [Marichromatium bheemlicum]NKN32338.1 GGDEF domain-containing protein [Marichromatium bheemlicum]